jgi:hypothetical protein
VNEWRPIETAPKDGTRIVDMMSVFAIRKNDWDGKKAYRYEARRYLCVVDADREEYGVTSYKLELTTFHVAKETPKGYWFGYWGRKDRFVLANARKKYAHLTKEEALEAFVQRKKSHVRHARARLENAEEQPALATGKSGVFS